MTGSDGSLGGTELWLTTCDQLVEIGSMWLRPNAVWAIRPLPVNADGPSCAVTGPGGAEYRLPGLTAEAAARLLNGDDASKPTVDAGAVPNAELTAERLWNRLINLPASGRLKWLSILLEAHRVAGRCFVENHDGLLARKGNEAA